MSLFWFKSYLSNRIQQMVINEWSSVNGDVLCGVRLLFLLFINDLPLSLKDSPISVDLYADDTILYKCFGFSSYLFFIKWYVNQYRKTKWMLIASRQKGIL